jgi:hypothetical protein
MQLKSRTKATGIFLILTTYLSLICSAQMIEGETNSSENNLTQEDYEAMLAVNNIKVYKFPVEIPEDQKCVVTLYKQEFDGQDIIEDKNIFGSNSPHVKVVDRQVVLDENGNRVLTPLNGIRIIIKEEGKDFALGIKMGEFEIPSMPVKIDSTYSEKHFAKSFSIPEEFPIGSEIPLLLIGSAWKATDVAGENEISKFCWGEFEGISPDFSQKEFEKMPHYIVFGIRVVEPR